MSCNSSSEPLKKTEYFSTLCKLTHLSPKKPIPLQSIIQLYRQGVLTGSLNYYRAILKTRNIVYASIRKSMYKIMNGQDQDGLKITIYEELYKANLVTDDEILEIFKEFSRVHPNEIFTALENQNSFLLKLCRLIKTDFSESICVIARTMLESNINSLLEYINKRQHSKTLKYLIKDIEGMAYLKENILANLTNTANTLEGLKEMLNRTISLHISLTKIDFTLVLLAPVMEYIKDTITEKLECFGTEAASEVLFAVISQRSSELVENVEETGAGNEKAKLQLQGDILDFLLSLLSYDSMMQTLALSISRDFILKRSHRQELLNILESKLGFYRASSIGIIKKDFEYFSNIEISESKVYQDVVGSTCIPKDIFSKNKRPNINHFTLSEHYWPETNYQAWDDLPTTVCSPGIYKSKKTNTNVHRQITLEYSKSHTYLDITVEMHGASIDVSVPISYVEYLYNRESLTEDEAAVIKEFWSHLEKKQIQKQKCSEV
ncbi:hypothetical protein NEMIN01_0651 [Nematocida minor]|uniref:uncharacterized protein n=1 Tax=Nematocida minor TaxID=1912983 RepID=UPI00221E86A0|nr:uncharacterized protein NEMIN01_0651 [Nematocida minor]KAI5189698.1 hypothetical protein NEMIN01_0651 [Nematocida minor]